MKTEQRRARGKTREGVDRIGAIDAGALRRHADAVQHDVGLVRRHVVGRLAEHDFEAVGQHDAGTVGIDVHADRGDREQPVVRGIEAAGFDVEHHPAALVGPRALVVRRQPPQPGQSVHCW